jgi:hypothetical protein
MGRSGERQIRSTDELERAFTRRNMAALPRALLTV